jgi:hypothetical protein
MGSLAPQGGGSGSGDNPITNQDESITVTTSYANALIIDSRTLKDNVIIMYNDDATIDCNYRIYASTKASDTVPADSDNSWVNIIDREVEDPSLYNHTIDRIIPAKGQFYESYSNKWSWVRIEMQSQSGTITCKIWHRGIN